VLLLLLLLCVQIAGGQRYRPPAVDVNAPDLFIPLMGLWSYALLSCVVLAFKHSFKPESMSSAVSRWYRARITHATGGSSVQQA
jgi:hypothetical protein